MNELVDAAAAIVRRDARVFRSYRLRPLKELVTAVFTVALFYELARLVSTATFPTPGAYFDFAVVGLATLPLLRAGLIAPPAALREELLSGTFERLTQSPAGAGICLLATLVFPFALALVTGLLILLTGAALFGLALDGRAALLAVPIGVLAALAIAPFGVLLLAAGVLVKQVNAGSGWLVAGLALAGGVYFPTAQLPGWIRWGADVQPLTPSLELLRHVLTGAPLEGSATADLLTLAAFGVIGLPLATAALGRCCARARRRGTLLDP